MDIDVRKHSAVHVIKLRGQFRLGQAVDEFRAAIDGLLREGHPQIVVNLADVPMLDSSGIGVLVKSQTSAKQHGGAVKLVSPSKFVLQTLKLVGLVTVFEIHNNDAAAVQSFGPSGAQAASS
ncbi:MAG TPA: STAS domain-containing protein [Terriglobales bacterium]|nr:STAS domain-containing protein [Terriglobales bacterium]